MNLECRIPSDKLLKETLWSIENGWQDMEYYTPCQVAPLIARELIVRVEAPFGGYYFELTEKGKSLLTQGDAEL